MEAWRSRFERAAARAQQQRDADTERSSHTQQHAAAVSAKAAEDAAVGAAAEREAAAVERAAAAADRAAAEWAAAAAAESAAEAARQSAASRSGVHVSRTTGRLRPSPRASPPSRSEASSTRRRLAHKLNNQLAAAQSSLKSSTRSTAEPETAARREAEGTVMVRRKATRHFEEALHSTRRTCEEARRVLHEAELNVSR